MPIFITESIFLATPDDPDPNVSGPWPLRNARIGWDNELILSTVEPAEAAVTLIPTTWERYRTAGTMTVTYLVGASFLLDYVGLAGHNFAGKTVVIEYSQSEAADDWVEIYNDIPADNRAIMALLGYDVLVAVLRVRVTVDGADNELAVVYAGAALQMPREIYGGHRPINMARQTEYTGNMSDRGQWLGRNVMRQGLRTAYEWHFLRPDWIRDYFEPFAVSAVTTPFFIAWRPEGYPTEVAYGCTNEDISPVNIGQNFYMNVGFTVVGHADT